MNGRVALFGGSFNPVHIGHLLMAQEVREKWGAEKIFFVPTAIPAHKSLDPGASDTDRLRMLRLATRGNPFFAVLDWEIEAGGVSRSVETLRRFERELGAQYGRPGFILGEDLLEGFSQWKEPSEIAKLSELIVVKRRRETKASREIPEAFAYPCVRVDNAIWEVSSSLVRTRIREGLDVRYFLHSEVYGYVRRHRLYQRNEGLGRT